MLYEIENLDAARQFLQQYKGQVVLSNPDGSTKYYGMQVLDYIFQVLKEEFPEKVEQILVNVFDDYAAFITARKLGYSHISYHMRESRH